jgi:hypothetical protein
MKLQKLKYSELFRGKAVVKTQAIIVLSMKILAF